MNEVSLLSASAPAQAAAGGKARLQAGDVDRQTLQKRAIEFEAVYLAQMLQPMFDDLKAEGLRRGRLAVAAGSGIRQGDRRERRCRHRRRGRPPADPGAGSAGGIAAMTTPGTPAAGLLDAIGRLADVIERENAALAAGGREPVRPLLEEKRTACRAYEKAVRELSELAGTDDVSRAALRRAAERLGRASAENRRRLGAAIAAHKRLLDTIAAAVRDLTPATGAYARTGAPSRSSGVSHAPPALSFDRAL